MTGAPGTLSEANWVGVAGPHYPAQSSASSHAPHIVHFYPAVSLSCQIIIGSSRDDGCVLLLLSACTVLPCTIAHSPDLYSQHFLRCPRQASRFLPRRMLGLVYFLVDLAHLDQCALLSNFLGAFSRCANRHFVLYRMCLSGIQPGFFRTVGWAGNGIKLAASFRVSRTPLPTAITS